VAARGHAIATLRGWTPFTAVQLPYGLIDRDAERELLPMAHELGLPVLCWGVLEGGVLTGKYLTEDDDGAPRRYDRAGERAQALAREVVAVAGEVGCTPAQAALAWVRRQPGNLIPIVGARTEAQLRENLGCLAVELTDAQADRLSAASPLDLGFPQSFLSSEHVTGLIFGTTRELIDV
jgi:aryl-alcohol dehydrogenase-like predicted oxidoreductase